jgi:uncharacterized lipoprotein YajG
MVFFRSTIVQRRSPFLIATAIILTACLVLAGCTTTPQSPAATPDARQNPPPAEVSAGLRQLNH